MLETRIDNYFSRGWLTEHESENAITVNTNSSALWFQNDEFYYDIVLGLSSAKVKIVITEGSTQSAVYYRFNELKPGIIWKASMLLGMAVDVQLYMQVTKPAEKSVDDGDYISDEVIDQLVEFENPEISNSAKINVKNTKKDKNDRTK